ncbi:MAG: DUF4440 domain-containing protein [Pseudomonadota bacterium]
MKSLLVALTVSLLAAGAAIAGEAEDRAAVERTIEAVLAAFADSDVDRLVAHFHPGVVQIPSYDKILVNRQAAEDNYRAAFARAKFDFVENDIENLEVLDDTAVYHARYRLKISPLNGAEPSYRSGRYMIVMVRHADSPTGWATYRELVQSEPGV